MKVKRVYLCVKCKQVKIRYRPLGAKPYINWCCGEKVILISNKCPVCKMSIGGANHFKGKHHLEAAAKAKGVLVGG